MKKITGLNEKQREGLAKVFDALGIAALIGAIAGLRTLVSFDFGWLLGMGVLLIALAVSFRRQYD